MAVVKRASMSGPASTYTYIHIYVYMYIYKYIYIHICIYITCIRLYLCTYTSVSMQICIICSCIRISIWRIFYGNVYACHILLHIHLHTMHICVLTDANVHRYKYIHVYGIYAMKNVCVPVVKCAATSGHIYVSVSRCLQYVYTCIHVYVYMCMCVVVYVHM